MVRTCSTKMKGLNLNSLKGNVGIIALNMTEAANFFLYLRQPNITFLSLYLRPEGVYHKQQSHANFNYHYEQNQSSIRERMKIMTRLPA
jgi:hypothetical protein